MLKITFLLSVLMIFGCTDSTTDTDLTFTKKNYLSNDLNKHKTLRLIHGKSGSYIPVSSANGILKLPVQSVDGKYILLQRIGDDDDDSNLGNNEGKSLKLSYSTEDPSVLLVRIGDDDDDSDLGNNSGKNLELVFSPEDPSVLLVRIGDDDNDSDVGNNSGKNLLMVDSSNNSTNEVWFRLSRSELFTGKDSSRKLMRSVSGELFIR